MKIKKNTMFIFPVIIGIFLMLTILSGCNLLYATVFYLWLLMFYYAYKKLESRSLLFAFLIAFFIFLLDREFLEQYFSYKVEDFTEQANNHVYFLILLSLITIFIGYVFFSRKSLKGVAKLEIANSMMNERIKTMSLLLYYVTICFAVLSKVVVSRYVSQFGYSDYYLDYSDLLSGNIILYIISKIELMMPVALSAFMASMPSKKSFKFPAFLYLLYLLISLGSGQRSTSMLGILFLLVYILFRQSINPEEKWFRKSYIVIGILMLPALAIFLSWYSYWRFDSDMSNFNWYSGLFDFFYDQGVTSNVLKRAYIYKEQIPDDTLYTLEFMRSGLIAKLLGIPVYHGNTVEHALYGGSYTHALGYILLKDFYLTGRGVGTSYIAELYQDFGYIGVVLGNLLYSYILVHVTNVFKKQKVFVLTLQFYMVTQILWAPRGSFSGFLTILFYPSTIASLLFIFGGAKILSMNRCKKAIKRGI